MTESSPDKNQIILLLLTLFIILISLFLWFPFYLPVFLLGESDVVLLIGYIMRLVVVVLLYLGYKRGVQEHPVEITVPDEERRLHFRYIDLFVLVLLYNITPNILDFIYSFFLDSSYNSPSSVDDNFYVDFFNIVFVGPVVEEIVFRWLFFKLMDRFDFGQYDFFGKMTLNVSVFAVIHYGTNFLHVFEYSSYLISIPLWTMFGFFAFLVYYHTRSLKLAISFHMMLNGFIMTVRWIHRIADQNHSDFRIESWWLMVLFVILVVVLYRKNLRTISSVITSTLYSKKIPIFFLAFLLLNIIFWAITYPFFYFLFHSSVYLLGTYMLVVFPLYTYGLIRVMQSDTVIMILD